jgi:hypothetical protein
MNMVGGEVSGFGKSPTFQKGLTKIRKSNGYKKPSRELNLRRV